MKINFCLLTKDSKAPFKKYPDDAGYDIYSNINCIVQPHYYNVVNTGICLDIPKGYRVRIVAKSRSNYVVGAGLVDSNYQGELLVKVFNVFDFPLTINSGDAVAQFIIEQDTQAELICVPPEKLYNFETDRGTTGGLVNQQVRKEI
jgi:dUTP pyrophosphatase